MKPAFQMLAVAAIALLIASGNYLFERGMLATKLPPSPQTIVDGIAPDAPLHVLFVGTSLTARGDWPDTFGDRVAACRQGRVKVERLARVGATSDWGAAALAERLKTLPKPHLVLVEFTINDARLVFGLSMRESRLFTKRMIDDAKRVDATIILVTMSPAVGARSLGRPFAAAYRAQYGELAEATGAGLIETVAAFEALPRWAKHRAIPDGIHPTIEAMNAILIPELLRQLGPGLCAAPPSL